MQEARDVDRSQPGMGEQAARAGVLVFLLLAIVTLAFGLGWGVSELRNDDSGSSPATAANGSVDPVGSAILNEIYAILQANYVDKDEIDTDMLRQAAIAGVINALNDRETQYITPEQLRAGSLDLASSYEGIGASVSDQTGAIQIVAPFRDSPAELAGIKPGDIVLEVNGESTDGWTDQLAVERIRGPRGTEVTLKVEHTDGTEQTLTITRGDIPIDTVFLEPNLEPIPGDSGPNIVDREGNPVPDIAYINIESFRDATHQELRSLAGDIESKYKGLILDLRANGGGRLDTTIDVADEFLNDGIILTEKSSGGHEAQAKAQPGGILTKIPIVILQDGGSASGAEVLAAALRDNGRAKIVGTRSFGKGTVNQVQELKNCGDPKGCGALYLAVARWYTPKGDQIEGTGIIPDFEVEMTSDQYIESGDIQLFKAIEVLQGK